MTLRAPITLCSLKVRIWSSVTPRYFTLFGNELWNLSFSVRASSTDILTLGRLLKMMYWVSSPITLYFHLSEKTHEEIQMVWNLFLGCALPARRSKNCSLQLSLEIIEYDDKCRRRGNLSIIEKIIHQFDKVLRKIRFIFLWTMPCLKYVPNAFSKNQGNLLRVKFLLPRNYPKSTLQRSYQMSWCVNLVNSVAAFLCFPLDLFTVIVSCSSNY